MEMDKKTEDQSRDLSGEEVVDKSSGERHDHASRPDPVRIAQDDLGPEEGYEDKLESPNNFDNAGRDPQQVADDNITQYTTGNPPRVVPKGSPRTPRN